MTHSTRRAAIERTNGGRYDLEDVDVHRRAARGRQHGSSRSRRGHSRPRRQRRRTCPATSSIPLWPKLPFGDQLAHRRARRDVRRPQRPRLHPEPAGTSSPRTSTGRDRGRRSSSSIRKVAWSAAGATRRSSATGCTTATSRTDGSIWIVAAGHRRGAEVLRRRQRAAAADRRDGEATTRPTGRGRAGRSTPIARSSSCPASLDVDPQTGDVYVADGELAGGNSRVAVLDRDGRFLRQWPLHRAAGEEAVTPLPHCLRVSNDGLVYVCDRQADRIQVFDRAGRFVRNIDVPFEPVTPRDAERTGTRGTAVVLAFSPDPEQRLIYVLNQNRVMVDVLDRQTRRGRGELRRRPRPLPRTVHAAPRHRRRLRRRRLRGGAGRPAHPEVRGRGLRCPPAPARLLHFLQRHGNPARHGDHP